MRKTVTTAAWAVFSTPATDKECGHTSVCPQEEWDAMSLAGRERLTLVRANITSEPEAERVARGAAGYAGLTRKAVSPKVKVMRRQTRVTAEAGPTS